MIGVFQGRDRTEFSIRQATLLFLLIGTAPMAWACSPIFPSTTILFPAEHQVVSASFHILLGDRTTTLFSKEQNQPWLEKVQLTNEYGDAIDIEAANGGLRPVEPPTAGNYQIILFPNAREQPLVRPFRVSESVLTTKPSPPKNFHWNLKRFDRPWSTGYTSCSSTVRDYITIMFETDPLQEGQEFIRYQVGFIPSEEEQRRHPARKLSGIPSMFIDGTTLNQTRGTPNFRHRWSLSRPIEHCVGLMVYDGYGNSLGPFSQCEPRKCVRGTEEEIHKGRGYLEDWAKQPNCSN